MSKLPLEFGIGLGIAERFCFILKAAVLMFRCYSVSVVCTNGHTRSYTPQVSAVDRCRAAGLDQDQDRDRDGDRSKTSSLSVD